MIYDLTIIGGGPAGAAAAVYAARKQLRTVIITEAFGGQSIVSSDIQNWIGTVSISGDKLAADLRAHVAAYAADTLDIIEGSRAAKIEKNGDTFIVTAENGTVYESKTVLITTGSERRKLTIPGADIYEHKGLTYCASCDGPLFSDMDVAVIGGGNAGFETAAQLLAYCKSVTLFDSGESFKADPVTVEKVLAHPHMKALLNTELLEVAGAAMVTTLSYRDKKTSESHDLPVSGIFVEIGQVPSTAIVANLAERDQWNHIKIDPRTQRTTLAGMWAAGDCTDVLYHQNNIAVGDAVRAIEDIYLSLFR
ncbi:MAG: FAD-dependent oxidoreductase [Minisyncoccota bacterium]